MSSIAFYYKDYIANEERILKEVYTLLIDRKAKLLPKTYRKIAELTRRILRLDAISINYVKEQLEELEKVGNQTKIMLEVSYKYLDDKDFASLILLLDNKTNIVIALESESINSSHYANIAKLQELGYQIALHGFLDSNYILEHLLYINFDYLKINCENITEIKDPILLLTNLNSLCAGRNLTLLLNGADTPEMLSHAIELGLPCSTNMLSYNK